MTRNQFNLIQFNQLYSDTVNGSQQAGFQNADLAAALFFELLVKFFLLAPDQIVYSKSLCLVSLLHNIWNNNENDEALQRQ